jgi:peptidoglycan/LPS O-acetylase OafA/YrhL
MTNFYYSPTIQIVRAIAILATMACHYFPLTYPFGYLGVDVFFVISGYLVTLQVYRNRFSMSQFYFHRAKRIFPATHTMVSVVLIVGFFVLDKAGFAELRRTAFSALLFYSNVAFAGLGGYFDGASELKPFLHTWSLSIEEQFYLLVSILLVLCKTTKIFLYVGTALMVGSFALLTLSTDVEPRQIFFLFQFRCWELLMGCLTAAARFYKGDELTAIITKKNVFFALAFLSVLLLTNALSVLGTRAALALGVTVPVAALLYLSSQSNEVRCVFIEKIGDLSFSLYLWHWPLLALFKASLFEEITREQKLTVLLVSAAIAYASYHLIEKPVRTKFKFEVAPLRKRFVFVQTLMFLSLLFATSASFANGVENADKATAQSPQKLDENEKLKEWTSPFRHCNGRTEAAVPYSPECTARYGKKLKVVVVGDSHADHFFPGIVSLPQYSTTAIAHFGRSSCSPFVGMEFWTKSGGETKCTAFAQRIEDIINANKDIEHVILAMRYDEYALGIDFGVGPKHCLALIDATRKELCADDASYPLGVKANFDIFERNLDRFLQKMQSLGKKVTLIEQTPTFLVDPYRCFLHFVDKVDFSRCELDRKIHTERSGRVQAMLARVSQLRDVNYIATQTAFCGISTCSPIIGRKLMFRDNNHVTLSGVEHIFGRKSIANKFLPLAADKSQVPR